ncbi:hypothetical protein GPECTOR_29g34 [Gonium pectorale]|uniref:Uncharacterized protein n=1 Tax=Gonium pectorale TaxID=33097 RepID=A0A150GFA4_GONPE|nr:hypothetical protein GPECTOR_29g34 [Gonium pectorale]|eukprot:KXZ48255.1 hypothetical protein GPECTOR_29g34 [Gonium pectorale]
MSRACFDSCDNSISSNGGGSGVQAAEAAIQKIPSAPPDCGRGSGASGASSSATMTAVTVVTAAAGAHARAAQHRESQQQQQQQQEQQQREQQLLQAPQVSWPAGARADEQDEARRDWWEGWDDAAAVVEAWERFEEAVSEREVGVHGNDLERAWFELLRGEWDALESVVA